MPRPRPEGSPFPLALALFLAVVALTFLPLVAEAEEDADSPLKAGAWAAEFELDPSFRYDFGFSSGATISGKWYRSSRTALRFGATAVFDESSGEGELSYERYSLGANPDLVTYRRETESHDEYHSYAVFVHLQRYYPTKGAIALFWELGPSLHFSESEYIDEYLHPIFFSAGTGTTERSERLNISRAVTLDLSIGFEWFFNRRLSLGARLGAWGGYSWGSETTTYEVFATDNSYYDFSTRRTRLESVDFKTSPTTVGLSAYF